IATLHTVGSHPLLDRLRTEAPAGVLELMRVPGLKPEKILAIHNELGIASLSELEEAARAGQLAKAKRLGEALQRKVLQGIEALKAAAGRRHIHRAAEMLSEAERQLRRTIPG